jgi:TonB family protein
LFSGALSRNVLLISTVTISHVLALLMLLIGSFVGEKAPSPNSLMVNLVGKSDLPSLQQKSLAQSQRWAPSNSGLNSSSPLNESHELTDGGGAGRLALGAARQAIHSPKPHYPLASRQLKEQGLVIARLCVSDLGLVQEVGITKSSGFQSLDLSAIKTLAQWRFAPVAINPAHPPLQCFQAPIQFTLEG